MEKNELLKRIDLTKPCYGRRTAAADGQRSAEIERTESCPGN